MDLIALATEAELKRSALPTVTESIHEVENQHPASHTAKSKAVYSRELITDRVSRDAPQTALKDALQRISLLEEELKLARAKTKEAERARNKMFKDLAAATKIEATLYDDSHFKEEVQQLRYRVYNWVKNRKWKVASQGQRRAYTALNQYDFLCTTCPSYQDYLGTKEGVHLLIEAHIWQCLVQNVFNCNLWAETRDQKLMKPTDLSDNPFTELKKALRPEIAHKYEKEVQDWRVASVRLVALRESAVLESIMLAASKRVTLALCKCLELLLSGSNSQHASSLEAIFKSAIKLDFLMQRQRADYHFFPVLPDSKNWHLRFDEEIMEVIDEDFEMSSSSKLPLDVKLVVQPNLSKCGDSRGENYDIRACLLKAEVEVMSGNGR